MPLTVRRGTPADLPTLIEFNCRLAEESEGKSLDRALLTAGITAALADPTKGPYFVAELDGQAVGVMQLTTEWSDWRNGWFWWIQGVYVRADARRKGVFRALYQHVHETAKQDPTVIGLRLYVERENRRAQETYLKLGMEWTSYGLMERYPL